TSYKLVHRSCAEYEVALELDALSHSEYVGGTRDGTWYDIIFPREHKFMTLFHRCASLKRQTLRPSNTLIQTLPKKPQWSLTPLLTPHPKAEKSTPGPRYYTTMKSAHVFKKSETGLDVQFQDHPIPSPEPNQVLIKVVVAGTNPKDWKYPLLIKAA